MNASTPTRAGNSAGRPAASNAPAAVSVVIATWQRPLGLRSLIEDLSRQTLAVPFEVIVVDDASPIPAADALSLVDTPARFRLERLERNGGQAIARTHGAQLATGDILVFLDDDMRVGPDFLAAHWRAHQRAGAPLVVLGHIAPASALATFPVWERYHARQLERFQEAAMAGRLRPQGVHLCSGNVSMTMAAFEECGGFDCTLRRSEDRDLGVRLQRIGARFVVDADTVSVHESDHACADRWLARAGEYGRSDTQITQRHPGVPEAHAWRFWPLMVRPARPLLAGALVFPALGSAFARFILGVAMLLDRVKAKDTAVSLAGLSFALAYFAGMRQACGSLRAVRAFAASAASAGGAGRPTSPAITASPGGAAKPVCGLLAMIRADHDATRRQRRKYHGEEIAAWRLIPDLVTKVGLQMLAMVRLMQWLHRKGIPVLPALVSRVIRHLYGADIHWRAQIAPGISVVHGQGLVISHQARVDAGCILFQGVTLGESIDPKTGEIGGPHVGPDVHIGPGAVVLGPIYLGAGSKVMANVVLLASVPDRSLVSAPPAVIVPRGGTMWPRAEREMGEIAVSAA